MRSCAQLNLTRRARRTRPTAPRRLETNGSLQLGVYTSVKVAVAILIEGLVHRPIAVIVQPVAGLGARRH
jgi:hypothetical protein